MALNWDELWNSGKTKVSNAFDTVTASGVASVAGNVEAWANSVLQAQVNAVDMGQAQSSQTTLNQPLLPNNGHAPMSTLMIAGIIGTLLVGGFLLHKGKVI